MEVKNLTGEQQEILDKVYGEYKPVLEINIAKDLEIMSDLSNQVSFLNVCFIEYNILHKLLQLKFSCDTIIVSTENDGENVYTSFRKVNCISCQSKIDLKCQIGSLENKLKLLLEKQNETKKLEDEINKLKQDLNSLKNAN